LIYAKRAAAEAERVFAIDEVVAAYGHARDCAEALGLVDEQLSLEEAIGKTYLLHGDMIPAGEHFERAMALTTDPHVRARLQTEAATSLVATGDQRGIEYLHEALKFLDPVKEPVATANALSNEARFIIWRGVIATRLSCLPAPLIWSRRQRRLTRFRRSRRQSSATFTPTFQALISITGFTRIRTSGPGQRLNSANGGTSRLPRRLATSFWLRTEFMRATTRRAYSSARKKRKSSNEFIHASDAPGTHFSIAFNSFLLGDLTRAENEYADGIVLAETIGERRVASLLKGNYAVLQAEQAVQIGSGTLEGRRLLDAALDTALQNFPNERTDRTAVHAIRQPSLPG
jgi:hypothetical protein